MRKLVCFLGGIVTLIVGGEYFARYGLGLGDPPLSIPDTKIDYLFAPNQRCNRFGNKIIYNNLSMRTAKDIEGRQSEERRIFVSGDSVVNGGALTSHDDLATTILQNKLPSHYVVCHVSAGSWGPGNMAAYFCKFQIVESNDVIIIEVNSHDLWEDDPAVAGGCNVGHDFALVDHKPFSALWEGFDRYVVPKVRKWLKIAIVNNKVDVPHWGADENSPSAKWNLEQMAYLYMLPAKQKVLLIHRSKIEAESGLESAGERAFRKQATQYGVPILLLNLNPATDYRDGIHLNLLGQRKMAEVILRYLKDGVL